MLYSCETWTTYRRHIQQLERFHQRCLRSICSIKWQDKVSNLEVLQKCGLPSVESLIIKAQLRWAGHVVRMPDSRIPKMLLYGQLKEGQRGLGRPLLRFRDTLKANLRSCSIDAANWEDEAADRERWRHFFIFLFTCSENRTKIQAKKRSSVQGH